MSDQSIPRDAEVFSNEFEKKESYKTLGSSLKTVLKSLLDLPLEKWEFVIALFGVTEGECFIAHTDAALSSLFACHVSNRIGRKNRKFRKSHFKFTCTNALFHSPRIGKPIWEEETHTVLAILKRLGQLKNIPGNEIATINDKQDDLGFVKLETLLKAFDDMYSPQKIIDWVFAAANGLNPFPKKMIPHAEIIDGLITQKSLKDSIDLSEESAKMYGASSAQDFIDNVTSYPYLTKKTIADLLILFGVLS